MNKPSEKELSSPKRWKRSRRNYVVYVISVFKHGALSDFPCHTLCWITWFVFVEYLLEVYFCIQKFVFHCNLNLAEI